LLVRPGLYSTLEQSVRDGPAMACRGFLLLPFLIALGCALGSREPGVSVAWEDDGPFAPRIGSLEVRGIPGLLAEDIWLVQGKLNQKALTGIFSRSPAESVLKRRVPAFVRSHEDELLVRPTVRL